MSVDYVKPSFYFVKGYRAHLDVMPPTRHLMRTCYSEFNRYPAQIKQIKSMMSEKKNGALRVLNIGVSQGQEPLTHINSAFELSKKSNRPISDFLDLRTVDILSVPPQLCDEAKTLDKKVVDYLQNVYDIRSGKSDWGMPIETAIDKMSENSEKQDVILFNNVLQHMATRDENALFQQLDKLVKLVDKNGIFCFSISDHTLNEFEQGRLMVMNTILNDNKFSETIKNSGIYKLLS